MPTSTAQGTAQVRTLTPSYTNPRWLGALGHINGLNWDYVLPGGPNHMSLTIGRPPTWRTDAINPGRIVEIWVGASRIWEGILDEPVPDTTGWSVTAHGAGTYGSNFMTYYTAWNFDNPLSNAITRGMRWYKPNTLGAISASITQTDNTSNTITDFMNNCTIQSGNLWNVDSRRKNQISIVGQPSTFFPNRILVCTVPNPRTLAAGLNSLWYKYVSAVSANGGQSTNSYANVANTAAELLHGPLEQQIDMTAAGLMTGTVAAANATNVLNQYVRANFSSTYDVRYGQYMTLGGTPIDLKTETAYPNVVRLVVTDGSYGGEVIPVPLTFAVGQYAYDQDSDTGSVTPYQSYKSDLGTLLTAVIPSLRQ